VTGFANTGVHSSSQDHKSVHSTMLEVPVIRAWNVMIAKPLSRHSNSKRESTIQLPWRLSWSHFPVQLYRKDNDRSSEEL